MYPPSQTLRVSFRSPTRPVSLNAGQHRPSWFDIRSFPPARNEWDEAAIASSVSNVEAWIQAEVHRGIDPRRIVLMGFSQGAALSLLVALTTLHELGGVISLAGWIPHSGREVSPLRLYRSDERFNIFAANRSYRTIPANFLWTR
jgi:predicted esterase